MTLHELMDGTIRDWSGVKGPCWCNEDHCGYCAIARAIAAYVEESLTARVKELEAAQAWQPIETAPKDGREVFLCIAGESEPHLYHASWTGKWQIMWTDGDCPVYGATHWKPLPEPPE